MVPGRLSGPLRSSDWVARGSRCLQISLHNRLPFSLSVQNDFDNLANGAKAARTLGRIVNVAAKERMPVMNAHCQAGALQDWQIHKVVANIAHLLIRDPGLVEDFFVRTDFVEPVFFKKIEL